MSDWIRGFLRSTGGSPGHRPLVVKIGGSLLARPAWGTALAELVASAGGPCHLVVGGGPVVDGLRTIDAADPRPAATMHWLAIEALGITARLVAEALGLQLTAAPDATATAVLDVPRWLRGTVALPEGWHVTSDSIAAVAAARLGGGLLLAKSVPPPAATLDALVAAGWLDAHFSVAARPLASIAWAAPSTPTRSRRPPDGH
ncbi:MAG: hypothetical protein ACKOC4_10240 [Planctomycetia bacterium]